MNNLDFCALLRVNSENKKAARILQTRIVAMGFGNVCERCGGSGHYSYNQVNGTTCFGCNGAGFIAQKLTPKLYVALEKEVQEGKLDAYLNQLRENLERTLIIKNASATVLDAWKDTGISEQYDWMKAAANIEPHVSFSMLSKVMCDAYEAVYGATGALESLKFKITKAKTPEARDEAKARFEVESRKLSEEILPQALNDIKVAAEQIPVIREQYKD